MPQAAEPLDEALVERVLDRLGFSERPRPTLDDLHALYRAWSQRVPFDNARKLIHLRRGDAGPLPGDRADDFFQAWLRYGCGATCWGGHGGLHALLSGLGFAALRGYATMLVAPGIPPNHATVVVDCEGRRYLVDASILHGEPLELSETAETEIPHAAWGVRTSARAGQRIVRWRPIHLPQGLDCRIDRLDVPAEVFRQFHEASRPWSPFNYSMYARVNRGDRVIGLGFGQRFRFDADGSVHQQPLDPQDRLRFLVEDIGIAEELAAQVPADLPTPPPPGSAAAVGGG